MSKFFEMLFIIFIFSLIHLFLTLSIGISHVRKNWDSYKCNPLIMPFAGIFGKDPIENSKACLQNIQIDFMAGFLSPIFRSLNELSGFGAEFADMFDGLKGIANLNQMLSLDMFSDLGNRMSNMGSGFGSTITDFNQGLTRAFSLITSVNYAVASLVGAGEQCSKEGCGTLWGIVTSFS